MYLDDGITTVELELPYEQRGCDGVDRYRLDLNWPDLAGITVSGIRIPDCYLSSFTLRIGKDRLRVSADLLRCLCRWHCSKPGRAPEKWKSIDVWDAMPNGPIRLDRRPLTITAKATPASDKPSAVTLLAKVHFDAGIGKPSRRLVDNPIRWNRPVELSTSAPLDLGIFSDRFHYLLDAPHGTVVELRTRPDEIKIAQLAVDSHGKIDLRRRTGLEAVVKSAPDDMRVRLFVGVQVCHDGSGKSRQNACPQQ